MGCQPTSHNMNPLEMMFKKTSGAIFYNSKNKLVNSCQDEDLYVTNYSSSYNYIDSKNVVRKSIDNIHSPIRDETFKKEYTGIMMSPYEKNLGSPQ